MTRDAHEIYQIPRAIQWVVFDKPYHSYRSPLEVQTIRIGRENHK
jgi:hypothetical protein